VSRSSQARGVERRRRGIGRASSRVAAENATEFRALRDDQAIALREAPPPVKSLDGCLTDGVVGAARAAKEVIDDGFGRNLAKTPSRGVNERPAGLVEGERQHGRRVGHRNDGRHALIR
jgi:hypothetical protein